MQSLKKQLHGGCRAAIAASGDRRAFPRRIDGARKIAPHPSVESNSRRDSEMRRALIHCRHRHRGFGNALGSCSERDARASLPTALRGLRRLVRPDVVPDERRRPAVGVQVLCGQHLMGGADRDHEDVGRPECAPSLAQLTWEGRAQWRAAFILVSFSLQLGLGPQPSNPRAEVRLLPGPSQDLLRMDEIARRFVLSRVEDRARAARNSLKRGPRQSAGPARR
jgi:hypothetical protein